MNFTAILVLLVNLTFIQGKVRSPQGAPDIDEHTHFDVYASAISRAHYSPWACDYRSEPGYNCLSCNKALHCYPGNFALLVQCAGIFPFCRNGYCSRFKTEGCIQETETHTVTHNPPPYVQIFNRDNKTSIVPGILATSDTKPTELNDPVPEESVSNTMTTELNEPNKIIAEGIVTPTDAASPSDIVVEKPKEPTRISETKL